MIIVIIKGTPDIKRAAFILDSKSVPPCSPLPPGFVGPEITLGATLIWIDKSKKKNYRLKKKTKKNFFLFFIFRIVAEQKYLPVIRRRIQNPLKYV